MRPSCRRESHGPCEMGRSPSIRNMLNMLAERVSRQSMRRTLFDGESESWVASKVNHRKKDTFLDPSARRRLSGADPCMPSLPLPNVTPARAHLHHDRKRQGNGACPLPTCLRSNNALRSPDSLFTFALGAERALTVGRMRPEAVRTFPWLLGYDMGWPSQPIRISKHL